MALQTSGPISLSDIKNEFNPFFLGTYELSDFYKGGGLIPNTPVNYDIPFVGEIALSDFYGASAAPEYFPAIMGYDQYSTETACYQYTTVAVYQTVEFPDLNNAIYSNLSGTSFSAAGFYSLPDPLLSSFNVRYWTGTSWSGGQAICSAGSGGLIDDPGLGGGGGIGGGPGFW
jgi:hypothetical protein